ncbi:BatD family protein [Azomonas macrocytogenes]|uniref:DUF7939 domain-containing protein n=1 Tax=Azomonas macrocytogenes TaxID=69962 RepID=A0A839T9M4_AZOMA|nr:BatD family protein [Azomonas macrocytogenes]MBB3104735.1 hypothetical protein [Azomonas macrocytogenes]
MKHSMLVILLGALAWQASAAGLTSRVDRTDLSQNETLELTLEASDGTTFGKPDLDPLNKQFLVGSSRQINMLSSTGGQTRAITRWIVTLQPRQAGIQQIPALKLGTLHSEPITLHVRARPAGQAAQLAPVFIDASLDHARVYVQAQAILTLRIYHSVSLYDDSTLSALQMDDAHVERLGEPRTYETTLNGIRHGVIEVRYAVFPQHSGELTVPGQTFSATSVAPNDADQSPLTGYRGRPIQVKSAGMPLSVLPKPAEYPPDAPWIPAASLSLNEVWSPQEKTARVGESITRSLMLKAEGLSAAQLPPIPQTHSANLRSYPDQPVLANEIGTSGLIGTREQSEALVPTQEEALSLPDIEIIWWNTQENRLEKTSLPGRTSQVAANPDLAQEKSTIVVSPQEIHPIQPLWPWQASSAVLACTTLLGFGLWLRARRQPAILRAATAGPSPRSLMEDLRRACQANDTQATRQALDAWARQQPETLAEIAARFVPLSDALDELNGALYSDSEAGHWQGEALWQAINTLPAADQGKDELEQPTLPPLYPR